MNKCISQNVLPFTSGVLAKEKNEMLEAQAHITDLCSLPTYVYVYIYMYMYMFIVYCMRCFYFLGERLSGGSLSARGKWKRGLADLLLGNKL